MKKQVVEKMALLSSAAFGLVAALAWNDAIKALFKLIFGEASAIISMFVYAIIVTGIAVFVTVWIGKISEKLD